MSLQGFTSSIFRSSSKITKVTALDEEINYFTFVGADFRNPSYERAKAAFCLAMIADFQLLESVAAPENAIGYILSVTAVLFPECLAAIKQDKAAHLKAHAITVSIQDIIDTFTEGKGEEDSQQSDLPRVCEIASPAIVITEQDWEAGAEMVGGRWGIEMFPIGKNVSPENLIGFRKNRTDAIMRIQKIGDEGHPAFREEVLPTLNALYSVERAFTVYKALRFSFARYWVYRANNGSSSRKEEMFLQTFRLTDGFGLGAPIFIMDLLNGHPKLLEFPDLAPAIKGFLEAMNTFATTTDESMRGYAKVLYGSNHRIFAASTRGPLLGLAVAFKGQAEETASRFLDTSPYANTIAKANAFLISHGLAPVTEQSAGQSKGADISEA